MAGRGLSVVGGFPERIEIRRRHAMTPVQPSNACKLTASEVSRRYQIMPTDDQAREYLQALENSVEGTWAKCASNSGRTLVKIYVR